VTVIDWLLESDPSIRLQVTRDLIRVVRGRTAVGYRRGFSRRSGFARLAHYPQRDGIRFLSRYTVNSAQRRL
jgi:hypothetical protein